MNDATASLVVAQLLYLEAQDPDKDIQLYINSPGGSVTAGMAIYDTMQYIKCDVSTICIGMAASMGAFLLSGGPKGKRMRCPTRDHDSPALRRHAGSGTDMQIGGAFLKIKEAPQPILAGEIPASRVERIAATTERDNFMTAEEAMNTA